MSVLLFRSEWDLATTYLSAWFTQIKSLAEGMGYQVLDLFNVGYEQLAQALQLKPALCFLGGHGNASQFSGYGGEVVLQACTNDQVMTGTESFFASCLVGQQLLPSIISKTGVSTFGFIAEFNWMVDTDYPPASDPKAASFQRMIVETAGTILQRGRVDYEAYRALRRIGEEEIAKWGTSTDPEAALVISALKHDVDAAILLGEYGAAIPVASAVPLLVGLGAVGLLLFWR